MTDRYRVEVARRVVTTLRARPRREQQRILAIVELLADDPRPPGCAALKGEQSVYRVRVGDYRVVYEVHDDVLLIQVVRIAHRREAYR